MSGTTAKKLLFTDSDNGGIIHVANIKGGVGKSTIATNVAAALSKRGPTLIIDLDVQGSATHALGMEPSQARASSWELLCRRFSPCRQATDALLRDRLVSVVRRYESKLLPWIVGSGDITSLAVNVRPGLDIIPAHADLFKPVHFPQLQNLVYNLALCRCYYDYVVIDTPSVWNRLTRALFLHSDLNLIPVTLNALSTRSLRDYLKSVRRLARKNGNVRVRIIKNEVFGTQASKVKGKTRTMNENRRFLESLCEQVEIANTTGVSLLPQSIMFDLEIPESAIVRSAQDEGKPVHDYKQYAVVTRAFEELAKRVQYVLNNPRTYARQNRGIVFRKNFVFAAKACAAVLVCMLLLNGRPVSHEPAPHPVAPQQLAVVNDKVFTHTFSNGESLERLAKYAICHYHAVVPSWRQINEYVEETMNIYNMTRMPGEPRITSRYLVPRGAEIRFYPPSHIDNAKTGRLIPVYRFFTAMVDDPFAYITGDWCERGTGGGTPHYGIDVAGNYGAVVRSPVDGVAYLQGSPGAGRMVGVVKEGTVIFFAHLDKRNVNSGDEVAKGDALGTIGMTGSTSGPHVHIGYGVKTLSEGGVAFGKNRYRLTDPKLFFYREHYMNTVE